MALAPHIFREYDIRGVVGRDFGPDVSEPVGRAFASLVREQSGKDRPTVVVGRDNRPSSPALTEALVRGIRAAGVDFEMPSWGTGEWEWQGFLDRDEHPSELNPAKGYAASWNNRRRKRRPCRTPRPRGRYTGDDSGKRRSPT